MPLTEYRACQFSTGYWVQLGRRRRQHRRRLLAPSASSINGRREQYSVVPYSLEWLKGKKKNKGNPVGAISTFQQSPRQQSAAQLRDEMVASDDAECTIGERQQTKEKQPLAVSILQRTHRAA